MDVRVFVADGCHLCDVAVEVVRDVCGEGFEIVDITDVPELERRYREWLPVVEIDGERAFVYHVFADALVRKLDGLRPA